MAIKITDPKIRVTMINDKVRMYLLPPLFNAAVRAGASIMRVYKNLDDYDISLKDDKTPITLADRVAHKTIREYLGPTRIPILSEEGRKMRYEERRNWELYWLGDPLDGTVEFIKGNNEFTVNIALMENNVCMGAVIYVPYFEKMYIAGRDSGSYLKEHIAPDAAAEYTYDEIVRNWTPLPLAGEGPHDHPRVALSRSHQTPETRAGQFLQILPAGRRPRRLLRPHDAHLRVGHGGGGADSRRGRRQHPHASRRPGAALQRGGPPQSVVRLPVEVLEDIGGFASRFSFCAGCVRSSPLPPAAVFAAAVGRDRTGECLSAFRVSPMNSC